LGEVLEDKEVVMQYAIGCQPEYMVAYQSLKRDANNKNEIVTMYMILLKCLVSIVTSLNHRKPSRIRMLLCLAQSNPSTRMEEV
jgi:hypothetical protein